MIIAIIGERYTGKSVLAERIKAELGAEVFTGRDYTRLAKIESAAQQAFQQLLAENQDSDRIIVYVISDREHLAFLPEKCVRILCTASLETIKARYAEHMNGMLPAPAAQMLEQLHGSFDSGVYDLSVDTDADDLDGICRRIRAMRSTPKVE